MRRWSVRVLAALVALAVIAVVVLPLFSADARFLRRAVYEEARILLKRKSLDKLIADSAIPPERREAFRLVRDARRFAVDSLGLAARGTFASFADVGHDTLVLVLSASPRNALAEYTWHYPIVGAVPYKGFFDFFAAEREAETLEAQGYDTYVRPAPAFSTLGWFDDPLLSTALTRDRVSLVAMVLHELTHNTIYVPSQTPFDESLAEFSGWRGAECFFASRGDSAGAARAAAIWRDERRLGVFYARLSARLDALYAGRPWGRELDSSRAQVFREARGELASGLGGTLEVYRGDRLAEGTLNNAAVIAQRIYSTHLDLFDRVLRSQGGDVRRALAAVDTAVHRFRDRDPFLAVASLDEDRPAAGCYIPSP